MRGEVIDWVKNRTVLRSTVVKETFAEMRLEIVSILVDENNSRGDKVKRVMQHLDNAEVKLKQQEVKVNREIQFTTWLFDTLHKMLIPHGFIVEPESENKCIIPTLCEYSTSVSDCLIYHHKSYCKSIVSGVSFMLEDCPGDEYFDDPRDLFGTDVHQISGQVFEVKVKQLNQAAINQCFYNMFGRGTRLATMVLCMGKLVNKVIMYGLVSAMEDRSSVKILQLEINFITSECHFRMLTGKYGFEEGLNMLLNKLLCI